MISKGDPGFSLLEVLIALFVLAIGLLGFAAIQLSATNAAQEGYLRVQASSIADNTAAELRAIARFIREDTSNLLNRNAASDTLDLWCRTGTDSVAFDQACPVVGGCDCAGAACSPAERLVWFKQQLCEIELVDKQLPDASVAMICHDREPEDEDHCSPGSRYTIFVSWRPTLRADTTGGEGLSQSNRCQDNAAAGGPELSEDMTCIYLELFL